MNNRVSLTALAVILAGIGGKAALAADMPPPPPAPAPEIRSSVDTWTGPYLGVTGGGTCMFTTEDHGHDNTLPRDQVVDYTYSGISNSGCGYQYGVIGGFNYQIGGNFVVGVEGDFTFGSTTGVQTFPNFLAPPATSGSTYKVNWTGTVRARAGWLMNGTTLAYVTGGVGWLNGTLSDGTDAFTNIHFGYVVGGGLEHALTKNIHLRAEYLFSAYNAGNYGWFCTTGACGTSVMVTNYMQAFHTFRAGVTFNFPISSW
ncbi:MAG TPA: porin family protein [Thermopetrobacter sp.]|nr:porin family protein [Thermopetrobacter sp.]